MSETLDDLLNQQSQLPVTTVLCDGDILAYRPAASCDGRMYTHKKATGAWKYKKDVDKFCKEMDLSLKDIQIEFFPEPIEHALAAMKMSMLSIKRTLITHCDNIELEVYISGEGNFRNEINPQYKANRIGVRRPHHLKACRDYLVEHYGAVKVDLMETDDMLTIRATELEAEGRPFVIASIDKDLKQMPGMHFDWVKDKYWEVTPEEARELLWTQVCTGDTTDNILSPEGIGPAKAKKLFEDVNWHFATDEELYEMVTGLYRTFLGKCGKKKKDAGIQAVTDFSDIRCFVEEIYHQVFLLRERL